MQNMNKAVFLDRDGTIIKDMVYLSKIQDIKLIPGSIDAIKLFNKNSFKVILITNQSGIARGYFSLNQFRKVNKKVTDMFKQKGAVIDDTFFCPHYDDGCGCRKPNPGMILDASKEHKIDLKKSFVIGDKRTDVLSGKRAGCRTILVLTGNNVKEVENDTLSNPDFIADNVLKAANWIIEKN